MPSILIKYKKGYFYVNCRFLKIVEITNNLKAIQLLAFYNYFRKFMTHGHTERLIKILLI